MAATCIVIPVPEAEDAVDLLRREHTRDGPEAMPAHITLVYPFADDADLVAGRISEVLAVLGQFAAFDFELSVVHRFDNLPEESYTTLLPSPSEPFVEMIEALVVRFPEHPPFGGAFRTVVPHLTVAASTDENVLRSVEDRVAASLPIQAHATMATIMENVRGAWRLRAEVPFAHAAA